MKKMDEVENPNEPKPVLQRNYVGRENEAMRLVLRAVAMIFVLWQFHEAVTYLIELASYLWEQNDLTVRHKLLSGTSLAIRAPEAIVSLYLVVNSPGIIKLTTTGRRWIILGSAIQGILAIYYSAAMSLYMVVDRQVFSHGLGYGVYYTGYYAVYVVVGPLQNYLFLSVFRSQAARDIAVT
jgi:hypothetical protein